MLLRIGLFRAFSRLLKIVGDFLKTLQHIRRSFIVVRNSKSSEAVSDLIDGIIEFLLDLRLFWLVSNSSRYFLRFIVNIWENLFMIHWYSYIEILSWFWRFLGFIFWGSEILWNLFNALNLYLLCHFWASEMLNLFELYFIESSETGDYKRPGNIHSYFTAQLCECLVL